MYVCIFIGSIALARTSTDPLFLCHAVCLSVCPEEWYKKQNNGVYYKKRAEREASPLRSSTKNRIMGYTIYYYIKRERREKHIYHFAQSMQNVAQRRDERGTSEERSYINTSNKRRERGAERRGKIELQNLHAQPYISIIVDDRYQQIARNFFILFFKKFFLS